MQEKLSSKSVKVKREGRVGKIRAGKGERKGKEIRATEMRLRRRKGNEIKMGRKEKVKKVRRNKRK